MQRTKTKTCFLAVALCVMLPGSIASEQKRRPGDPISPDYRIYSLQIDEMSMMGALLALGRQLHIPMGIRYLDRDAVQKPVSVRWLRVRRQKGKVPPHLVGPTLATALTHILSYGADYTWNIRGTVVAYYGTGDDAGPSYTTKPFGSPIQIDNRRARWPTHNLLNFRLTKFKIPKCTIEEASHRLEVALNAALNPGALGVIGDHYPGTGKNMVGPLTLRRHTVADILDELVAKGKNAAWVVQVPPEAVDRLAPEGLWRIIDYDDPAFDQAVEAVKQNILRYPGSETFRPEPTEYVQISAVSVTPNTLNASSSPTSATITVQVYHGDSWNLYGPRVMVNIATYNPSPPGNNVSILPTEQVVSVMRKAGYVTVEFPVNAIPGTTVQGSIGIKVWLTNPHPAENMTILDPDPVSNAQTTLNTTSN